MFHAAVRKLKRSSMISHRSWPNEVKSVIKVPWEIRAYVAGLMPTAEHAEEAKKKTVPICCGKTKGQKAGDMFDGDTNTVRVYKLKERSQMSKCNPRCISAKAIRIS